MCDASTPPRFNNRWRVPYQPVNTGTLQARFEDGAEVTRVASRAGVLPPAEPVKILATGELTRALNVHAHKVSAAARARIEGAGGTVTLIAEAGDEAEAATGE